jgi:hypothetical protein
MTLRTVVRCIVGLFCGVLVGGTVLLATFQLLEWLIPVRAFSSQGLRSLMFLSEMALFCIAGLIFGVVSALVARNGGLVLAISGGIFAFICLLPYMFIEGHFWAPMIMFTLPVSMVCAVFVKIGQVMVSVCLKN